MLDVPLGAGRGEGLGSTNAGRGQQLGSAHTGIADSSQGPDHAPAATTIYGSSCMNLYTCGMCLGISPVWTALCIVSLEEPRHEPAGGCPAYL